MRENCGDLFGEKELISSSRKGRGVSKEKGRV